MDVVCYFNASFIYNSEEMLSLKYTWGARAIVSIILPIMAIFGAIFNGVFIFAVYRVQEMRTITNLFLVQLAVCDIGTLSSTTVRYLVSYLKSREYYFVSGPAALCATLDFLMYFFYFVSVFLICAVSVERYIAICKPLHYHVFRNNSRASKTSLTIAGFILAIPGLLPYKEATICAEIPSSLLSAASTNTWMVFETCVPTCDWCFHSLLVSDTVQFVLVFVCNSAMYVAIIKTLRKRSAEMHAMSSMTTAQLSSQRVEQYFSRMLIINGVTFFILLGPYEVWNVVFLIQEYSGILIISQDAFYWLGYIYRLSSPANFMINPLIYGVSNPRYREAILVAFRCSSLTKQDMNTSVNTVSAPV